MVRTGCLAIGLALAAAGAAGGPPGDAPSGDAAAIERAIAAEEAQGGRSSPLLLPLLTRLAQRRFEAGELDAATAAERRGLAVARAAFGPDSPRTAEAMTALAAAELDQLRYRDAEPLLILAERTLAAAPGGADPAALAPVLSGLSRVALARGNSEKAEREAERAVALAGKAPSPRPSEPLRRLGAALAAEHKFADGERVLRQALAADRARTGDDSLDTARSLSALGDLYLRADRFADALAPLEQAAAIDQARLAPDHPVVADDLGDIAIADEGLKRIGLARRLLTAAIRLLRQGGSGQSLRLGFAELELSRIDRAAGDGDAADALFHDAQRILNKAEDAERRNERRI